jgi:hypothetical protein
MALDIIYIMCAAFLILARDIASKEGRRRLLNFQNEEDDWMARAGRDQEATRVNSIQIVSKQLTCLAQLVSV